MHQPNEILDGIFANVGDDAQNVVDDQPGHLQEQPQSQVVDSKREVMNSFVPPPCSDHGNIDIFDDGAAQVFY